MNPAGQSQHASWGFDIGQLHDLLRKAPRRPSSVDQQARFRSNRISKPSSTGNSPHHSGLRRSTVAAASILHPNTISPQDYHLTASSDYPKARPISWHPSSFQQPSQPVAPSYYLPQASTTTYNFPSQSFTTTQVHGLITPLSQPCFEDPFNAEALTGLDEDPYAYLDEFRGSSIPEWVDYAQFPDSIGHLNSGHLTNLDHLGQPSHRTKPKMETAPPSPAFLPIQGQIKEDTDESTFLSRIQSTTDDLVGMGLYDPPSAASGMLLGGSLGGGSIGKGLKLEETFEPSMEEDDDEDDEDDDEDLDGEGEEDLDRQSDRQSNHLVIPNTSGGWI